MEKPMQMIKKIVKVAFDGEQVNPAWTSNSGVIILFGYKVPLLEDTSQYYHNSCPRLIKYIKMIRMEHLHNNSQRITQSKL